MIAVVLVVAPVKMPVTAPEVPTIVTAIEVLLHVPPAEPSVSVVVSPWHTDSVPPMFAGNGLTVITVVAGLQAGVV